MIEPIPVELSQRRVEARTNLTEFPATSRNGPVMLASPQVTVSVR